MNAAANTPLRQTISLAGSVSRPWLWQVWAVVVILFVVVLVVQFALPSPLAISPPTLSFLGDVCTVSFRATNNTERPVSEVLRVVVSIGTPTGHYTPPTEVEFARTTLPMRLAPKESRKFACEFPVASRPLPNTAQIEVAPANASVR